MHAVGLLVPASNTVIERDLHRELGTIAAVHTARMALTDVTGAAEQRMLDEEALPAAGRLLLTRPDVVVFGCTSAGTLHDSAYDEALRARLAEVAGAPIVGVMPAVLAELEGHGDIALLTPYVEELTDRIVASLEAAGHSVVARRSLGLRDNADIGALAPHDIVTAVSEMDLDGADAVLCSCTNLHAYEALDELREATGLPVVSSNQAAVAQVRVALGEG